MRERYDILVIGGGHAGAEAAWAAASVLEHAGRGGGRPTSGRVGLVTLDPACIGQMSCNPAIGGLAKGQMVREIDALGGIMGRAIDATGIMFKMLNTSKGPAVRGPRAQADKYAYAAEVRRLLATRDTIEIIAGRVEDLHVEDGRIRGIAVTTGDGVVTLASDAVVLTTGTFMRGLMHTGPQRTEGGRVGEAAANAMSATLQRLGFELGRLKTGTPPRLARESLDWAGLEPQMGDAAPRRFSDYPLAALPGGRFPVLEQTACRITATCAAAHDIIRDNLDRAPMFTGQIDAECGPRYCPSIEDKVVRFADRASHHVFLEPESLDTNEVYANGISTSLPADVQERIVKLMPGCGRAEILRYGYAVEYDMVWPHQLDATTMTKRITGLFLAGQINCTTGYEEAASQGVIAGLNAARLALGEDLVRVRRDQGYIGVMLDDLVTKTPREPYRMFTSRAEHRLLLRADNADTRLTPLGRELGLVDDPQWDAYERRVANLETIRADLEQTLVDGRPLREVARRTDQTLDAVLAHLDPSRDADLVERVVTDLRYAGYVRRQETEIGRHRRQERQRIPSDLDFGAIPGLRAEAAEVLTRFTPRTMGQAGRLAGVNPADLTLVAVAIRRRKLAAAEARDE